MGTSEDDSDYAYIDRSTHSITGYLQSPNNTNIKNNLMKNSTSFDAGNTKKKHFGEACVCCRKHFEGVVEERTTLASTLKDFWIERRQIRNFYEKVLSEQGIVSRGHWTGIIDYL